MNGYKLKTMKKEKKVGHIHPNPILLAVREHHSRYIHMLSVGSEDFCCFCECYIAQFLFILCTSIVLYFIRVCLLFFTWLWKESLVFSKGVSSCSQEHICQRKHWQERQGCRVTTFAFIHVLNKQDYVE